jgi:hypothetical protein
MRQPRRVNGLEAIEILANLAGDALLTLPRPITELGSKRGSSSCIDAKRGRTLWLKSEKVVGNAIEQRAHIGLRVGCGWRRRRRLSTAPLREWQSGRGCERRKNVTSAQGHAAPAHDHTFVTCVSCH